MRKFFTSRASSQESRPTESPEDAARGKQLAELLSDVEDLVARTLGGTRGLLDVGEHFLAFEGICTAVIDGPVAVPAALLERLHSMATSFGASGIITELSSITPNSTERGWMGEPDPHE